MKKPKIVHLLNNIGLGGVTVVVYHLLRSLPRDKYDLSLCTLKDPSDSNKDREHRAALFRDLGVHITSFDQDKKKFNVIGGLSQWLLDNSIDILHTHSYKPNIFGRMAGVLCRPQGLKMVSHYHNGYDDKWEKDQSLIYDQLLHHHTEACIACSEWVRRHVADRVRIPEADITMIPNGVDEVFFSTGHDPGQVRKELNIPPGKKVIGIVGRISEQKAQDDFLHAAKIIHQKNSDTIFLIVGSGKEADITVLRNLAKELNIENSVIFLGHYDDMPKLYNIFDVMVAPSRWEGFGLILVEAMAAGKPVVATNVGPIPDVVTADETAFLVPPDAPQALAAQVVRLLADPDLAKAFGEKGKDRAKLFSWKSSGQKLDRLYESLELNP